MRVARRLGRTLGSSRAWLILYAVLALVILARFTIWRPAEPPLAERASTYLRELAFGSDPELREILGSEYDLAETDRISKWTVDIKIRVEGKTTARDLATIAAVIQELDELIEPISVVRTWTVGEANVTFLLTPRESFAELAPITDNVELAGIGLISSPEGVNVEAWIFVDSGLSDDKGQDTIREEITQVIGLPHDSWKCPESVFYQGYNEVFEFTELDKAVIRLLYDPRIEPGMTLEELQPLGL